MVMSRFCEKPSTRKLSRDCVSAWHSSAWSSGLMQLSNEITASPAISAAPNRFSNSASSISAESTGAGWPDSRIEIRSINSDLPVPGAGAVIACKGAKSSVRRHTPVSKQRERHRAISLAGEGKGGDRLLDRLQRARASSLLGCRGSRESARRPA